MGTTLSSRKSDSVQRSTSNSEAPRLRTGFGLSPIARRAWRRNLPSIERAVTSDTEKLQLEIRNSASSKLLQQNPIRWIEVAGIALAEFAGSKPGPRCRNNLFDGWIEPRTPPAERAIGDDVMAAPGHQCHILPRLVRIAARMDEILLRYKIKYRLRIVRIIRKSEYRYLRVQHALEDYQGLLVIRGTQRSVDARGYR